MITHVVAHLAVGPAVLAEARRILTGRQFLVTEQSINDDGLALAARNKVRDQVLGVDPPIAGREIG